MNTVWPFAPQSQVITAWPGPSAFRLGRRRRFGQPEPADPLYENASHGERARWGRRLVVAEGTTVAAAAVAVAGQWQWRLQWRPWNHSGINHVLVPLYEKPHAGERRRMVTREGVRGTT
jgi:hypothetical protein